jgi:hypothetical protein
MVILGLNWAFKGLKIVGYGVKLGWVWPHLSRFQALSGEF